PGPQLVLLVLETGPLPGERVDFLYGVGRLLAVGCRYREQQQRANRHPSRCHYGSAHVLFFEALRRSDESMHGSVRCKRKAAGRKIPDPCGGAARRTNRGVMVRSRFADDLRYRRETSQMPLHRMRSLLAAALAIVTLAASSSVLPQPLLDLSSGNAELEIVDRLAQIEAQHGPRSSELIAPLRTLALLYQERGENALAAAAVDRAWELVRINHGVQSLDQADLIRQRIEIANGHGDLMEAWNLEQALLVLARRHSDDARTVGILHRLADERMSVLERYVDGEFRPPLGLGCYYAGAGDDPVAAASDSRFGECTQGFRGVAIRSILWEAQMLYSDAIKAAIANDLYSSDELRELEMKLVRSSFLYGAMYEDGRDYLLGRESLRRLAAYDAAVSAPLLAQIEALIR